MAILKHTIYVRLLDEGTSVWRPVEAIKVGEGLFQIISTNSDPEDEKWEFVTGTVVHCIEKSFSDASVGIVAIERVNVKTEF